MLRIHQTSSMLGRPSDGQGCPKRFYLSSLQLSSSAHLPWFLAPNRSLNMSGDWRNQEQKVLAKVSDGLMSFPASAIHRFLIVLENEPPPPPKKKKTAPPSSTTEDIFVLTPPHFITLSCKQLGQRAATVLT